MLRVFISCRRKRQNWRQKQVTWELPLKSIWTIKHPKNHNPNNDVGSPWTAWFHKALYILLSMAGYPTKCLKRELTENEPKESNLQLPESCLSTTLCPSKDANNRCNSNILSSLKNLLKEIDHDRVTKSQWSRTKPLGLEAILSKLGIRELKEDVFSQSSCQSEILLPLPSLKEVR